MVWTRRDLGRLTLGAAATATLPRLGQAQETTVAHGVSAFGDLKYPADFVHFDYVNPDAPVGGTYSTGIAEANFDSFNSFILKGNPAGLLALLHDSLMTSSGDEADSVYGLVAESVEYPADRMWAAFQIRETATFSDGSPVTAEDVVFTFDILREKGHPSYRVLYAPVERAVAEAPRRVRFDFFAEAPRRDLPMAVAGLPILSKAWYTAHDFSESSMEPPVGCGGYAIESWEPGRTIVYRRRDDYWGWDLPVNRGRWNFEHIRLEYFRDRTAEFEAFKSGAFTHKEEFWSKQWATGYDFPAIQRGDVVREIQPDNRPSGSQGYWFNTRREKFADPRVRKAISLGFDFEWSNSRLFYDLYTRTDSFFEGGPMQAEGLPGPEELAILEPLADRLPPGVLDEPAYVPPVTDGSGRNREGLRAAVKLLDEAGWTVQGGMRRNAKGETLVVEFLDRTGSAFDRITTPYIQNLRKIGIDASQRSVDPAQYQKRVEDFDFDVVVDRKGMSLTPGVELRDYFHSSSVSANGSENLAGIDSPVVDALIDRIERAASRDELTVAVKALDRVLRAMHVWVPQWNKGSHTFAYWDIYAHPAEKPPYAQGVLDLWWIDPAKYERLKAQIGG